MGESHTAQFDFPMGRGSCYIKPASPQREGHSGLFANVGQFSGDCHRTSILIHDLSQNFKVIPKPSQTKLKSHLNHWGSRDAPYILEQLRAVQTLLRDDTDNSKMTLKCSEQNKAN